LESRGRNASSRDIRFGGGQVDGARIFRGEVRKGGLGRVVEKGHMELIAVPRGGINPSIKKESKEQPSWTEVGECVEVLFPLGKGKKGRHHEYGKTQK